MSRNSHLKAPPGAEGRWPVGLRRLACRLIGHRRRRRFKYLHDGQWRSRCARCGRDLVRGPHRWIAA